MLQPVPEGGRTEDASVVLDRLLVGLPAKEALQGVTGVWVEHNATECCLRIMQGTLRGLLQHR
jgi:hypothetical protein